jgi:predicted ester cyclase
MVARLSQEAQEQNLKLVQRTITEGPNVFDEVFSPNLVNTPPLSGSGPDALRASTARFKKAIKDLDIQIEAQFTAGPARDLVTTVWRLSGTHVGDLDTPMGPLKATNNPVSFQLITTVRIQDGKIVERWGQL